MFRISGYFNSGNWLIKFCTWLEIIGKVFLVFILFYLIFFRFLPNDESLEPEISQQLSMESSNSLGQDVFYDAQVADGGRKISL